MPQIVPFLPLITAGVQTAGGLLANRKSKATSSSTQNTNSTVTPTLAPEYQPLQAELLERIKRMLLDPNAGTEPLRLDARNKVNANYDGVDQALRDRLLGSGGGRSGKFGAATRRTELARIGGLSDLEGTFAGLRLGRQDQAISMAERLLLQGRGENRTGTASGEQVGTQPGNMAGGALAGLGQGLGSLTTLMTLDKLLKGSGGRYGGYGSAGAPPAGGDGGYG